LLGGFEGTKMKGGMRQTKRRMTRWPEKAVIRKASKKRDDLLTSNGVRRWGGGGDGGQNQSS